MGALALVLIVTVGPGVLTTPTRSPQPTPIPTEAIAQATPSPTPQEEPTPTEAPTATPAVLPSTAPAIVTAKLSRSSDATWFVNWLYPQIRKGSTPFAESINEQISTYVTTTATAWAEGDAAGNPPPAGGAPNALTGKYTVALSTPRLLSLRFIVREDMNGAHPATSVSTQTYDLATGRAIGIGDLFSDAAGALAILSEKTRATLKAQLGDAYDPTIVNEGTRPDVASNFATWALTPGGLEITFQEYQVAPAALANPVVVVPWADLKNVLNPEGPVASLIAG